MCTAGQRVSLTITGPGLSFFILIHFYICQRYNSITSIQIIHLYLSFISIFVNFCKICLVLLVGPRAAGPRTSGPKGYLALGLLVLLGDITSGKLGGCLERQLDALS